METTKTQEGYNIPNLMPYDVVTSIYKHEEFNANIREKGFCGFVLDPNQDDRFLVSEWCIWNEKGDLIYSHNGRWGEYKHYKLILN